LHHPTHREHHPGGPQRGDHGPGRAHAAARDPQRILGTPAIVSASLPRSTTSAAAAITIAMHDATIPTLIRPLYNLPGILAKGAEHTEAKETDPAVLINDQLFPEMCPCRDSCKS
jgi:hypothetical protein